MPTVALEGPPSSKKGGPNRCGERRRCVGALVVSIKVLRCACTLLDEKPFFPVPLVPLQGQHTSTNGRERNAVIATMVPDKELCQKHTDPCGP